MNGAELYDLHVHSTNSDGLQTPREVIREAGGRVTGFAFTDHSGVTTGADLAAAAEAAGTRILFPGVEVSTMTEGRKYHVLAYGRGVAEDPGFRDFVFYPTKVKNEAYGRALDRLRELGAPLPSFRDILAGGDELSAPRPETWMMSKRLIRPYLEGPSGHHPEAAALLETFYEEERQAGPDRYLDTAAVIRAAREVGALPVLAHPWWEIPAGRNSPADLAADVARFIGDGLLALEVSSRHDNVGTEEQRREFAHTNGLAEAQGSDYHANGKSAIGERAMSGELFARLVERADREGVKLW